MPLGIEDEGSSRRGVLSAHRLQPAQAAVHCTAVVQLSIVIRRSFRMLPYSATPPYHPAAVDTLHSRLEEEAQQWRQLHGGAAATAAQLEVGLLGGTAARQSEAAAAAPDSSMKLTVTDTQALHAGVIHLPTACVLCLAGAGGAAGGRGAPAAAGAAGQVGGAGLQVG